MQELSTRKAVWALVCALPVLIVAQTLGEVPANLLLMAGCPMFVCNVVVGVLYAAFAYWLVRLLAKKLLGCPLEALLITGFRLDAVWVAAAFLLPACVTGAYFLLPGRMVPGGMDTTAVLSTVTAAVFFTGGASGIAEEMIFRGLVMGAVRQRWGERVAVLVPSVLFGLIHVLGRDFTPLSCLQVLVAGTAVGIMFSLIALESGSVWNGALVHAVWNAAIIGGLLSIGTVADGSALLSRVLQTENFAITGGQFGIESSVISIAGYAVVGALAWWRMKRRR